MEDRSPLPDALPARHRGIEVAEFDAEFVAFDPRCSEVHLLSGMAAVVFDACDGSTPTAVLVDELVELLELSQPDAETAVRDALGELAAVGALEGTDPGRRPP